LPRVLPARYVPPSGFDYPLDGFRPSIPRRFCFAPAALLGFTLRSFLLPKGRPCVSAPAYPPTVPPASGTTYRSRRPALQAAVSGHCPSGSPWRPSVGLARQPLAAPLGSALLGFALGGLNRVFTRSPLTRFAAPRSPAVWPAPQSFDRPPPAPGRSPACKHTGRSEEPFEGFRTGTIPSIRVPHAPGYLVHLTPRRALLSTGRRSLGRA